MIKIASAFLLGCIATWIGMSSYYGQKAQVALGYLEGRVQTEMALLDITYFKIHCDTHEMALESNATSIADAYSEFLIVGRTKLAEYELAEYSAVVREEAWRALDQCKEQVENVVNSSPP